MRYSHSGKVAAIAWSLAAALAIIYWGVVPLLPDRVNIRWAPGVSDAQREEAERALSLTNDGKTGDQRSWSYIVADSSPDTISAIVQHPLIDDTGHIDRDTFTLVPELAGHPRWRQLLAEPVWVRRQLRTLGVSSLVLTLVGFVAIWPVVAPMAARVGASLRADAAAPGPSPDTDRRLFATVGVVVAASFVLRAVLALKGGAFYWDDEWVYNPARSVAGALVRGDVSRAFAVLAVPVNPLFTVIALPPALIEQLVGVTPKIAGVYFAAVSSLNVGLIALVARRLGAGPLETGSTAVLAATATTLLYYSRHLLAYDTAMALALAALSLGVTPRRRTTSLWCGLLAGCAFLTYAGYWTVAGAALILHVLAAPALKSAFERAALAASALGATLALHAGFTAVYGVNALGGLKWFGSFVDQGTYSEGWSLPWEYLWHAEHGVVLLWITATLFGAVSLARGTGDRRTTAALIGLVFIYGWLVFSSVGLHGFVVYGRLARQLVPFFCLISGAAIASWVSRVPAPSRRPWLAGATAVLALQAAINFHIPVAQVFPEQFLEQVRLIDVPPDSRVVTVNAEHLYPGPETTDLPPRATVALQARHPLQFLPYEYEGYTPEQRDVLRHTDISMKALVIPIDGP
jgi:hypothetical protein